MKLKPPTPKADVIDSFIRGATADKKERETNPAEGVVATASESSENENKRLQQTSTSRVNIDDLVGRGGVFAATFKRETYYVHKELVKALNKKAAKGGKGEKTRIINLALQAFLESESQK